MQLLQTISKFKYEHDGFEIDVLNEILQTLSFMLTIMFKLMIKYNNFALKFGIKIKL